MNRMLAVVLLIKLLSDVSRNYKNTDTTTTTTTMILLFIPIISKEKYKNHFCCFLSFIIFCATTHLTTNSKTWSKKIGNSTRHACFCSPESENIQKKNFFFYFFSLFLYIIHHEQPLNIQIHKFRSSVLLYQALLNILLQSNKQQTDSYNIYSQTNTRKRRCSLNTINTIFSELWMRISFTNKAFQQKQKQKCLRKIVSIQKAST